VKIPTQLIRESLYTPSLRKTLGAVASLGLILSCASSCGLLGNKEKADRNLAQSGGACLDGMGPLAKEFLDGTVNETQWLATWDCVDDTIDLFSKFVKGSDSEGYLPDDLRFLMQKFMFSVKTVTPSFVEGSLSLKASLFGGTANRLSNEELNRFRELARFLKVETTVLIPHLKNRRVNPTPANLRAFAAAIENFGNHLADHLNTGPNAKWTIQQAVQFSIELGRLAFDADSKTVEEWTRLGQEVKFLLVRGASDGIDGKDWTKILKFGFRTAGVAIAYLDTPESESAFQIELVNQIQNILNQSISDWNGELPFAQIEKIVDHLPLSLLPDLADDFKVGVKSLLHERVKVVDGKTVTYRPTLAHLFQTRSNTGIDAPAVERLLATYRTGARANAHLKAIYASTKEDLLPSEFEERARMYMAPLDSNAKTDVLRLITLAKRYPGLHSANSPEILFTDQSRHSLNNLNKMSWYELASSTLLDAYGTKTDQYGKSASVEDLDVLVDDLRKFLFSVQMAHPSSVNIGAKRFREANLFMPAGNGDDRMDLTETTVYLAFLFSSGRQNSRIVTATLTGERPCPMLGWNVPLKIPVYDVQCFRDRFAQNFGDLFVNMPRLREELDRMTTSERKVWDETLEYASKWSGYDEEPISEFDIGSYAGLPHYAEAVMNRFDKNHDGALDKRETIDHVFPIFKRELAKISKIKIDFVNKAVLLYLMQNGKEPEIKDLLGWALKFEFLKDFKARRIRVYQIFAALTEPYDPDPITQLPPKGLLGSSALGVMATNLVLGLTPVETTRGPASAFPTFDLNTVDPTQLQGYSNTGPIIDPNSTFQEALEVLPQDL
jgi:hypothetical protein